MPDSLPKILLPGGSGHLGSLLAVHLASQNYRVIILSRSPRPSPHPNIRYLPWNARTLGTRDSSWARELESATALINLTGRSVDCRYTPKNRQEILDSRILSTQVLGQAVAQCRNPPPIWLNASTATIYKHSCTPQDELTGTIAPTPEANDAFSIRVATQWEQTLADAPTPRTRKIPLRAAMVLSNSPATVLPILRRLVHLGFGGPIAGGRQFVSWIHHLDFCRAIDFLLAHPEFTGPFNLAAPNPLTLADFLTTLRQTDPTGLAKLLALPTPRPLLNLGCLLLRTQPELLIKSRYVLPTRLLAANFQFLFPTLPAALADLQSHKKPAAGRAQTLPAATND